MPIEYQNPNLFIARIMFDHQLIHRKLLTELIHQYQDLLQGHPQPYPNTNHLKTYLQHSFALIHADTKQNQNYIQNLCYQYQTPDIPNLLNLNHTTSNISSILRRALQHDCRLLQKAQRQHLTPHNQFNTPISAQYLYQIEQIVHQWNQSYQN